jgi:hypothetical protein
VEGAQNALKICPSPADDPFDGSWSDFRPVRNRIAFRQVPFDAVFKNRMDNRAIADNALWTKE